MARSDFSQLKMFQKRLQLAASEEQRENFYVECCKYLAARFLAKVIKRTPAISGNLRRGWTNANDIKVEKVGKEYRVTITNSADYAEYVEYGHRTKGKKGWVNGQFMMTKSAEELMQEAPKILKQKYEKYLREVLDGK